MQEEIWAGGTTHTHRELNMLGYIKLLKGGSEILDVSMVNDLLLYPQGLLNNLKKS